MMKIKIAVLLLCLSCAFPKALAEEVTFTHGEYTLVAHYLPAKSDGEGKKSRVIIFVHGDGALDYTAHGYYPLLWENLRKQGFAVFSWDKAGVGQSTGQWLNQSMTDRQAELHAAIAFLQDQYGYQEGEIGLLGFSQAGWVVPKVAAINPSVGFVVGVGFAIDWQQQSAYLTKTRLMGEGATSEEIQAALQAEKAGIAFLKPQPSYDDYLARYPNEENLMSEARFHFVLKNYQSNALSDYANITQPVLLLMGEEDLNVDVQHTQNSLRNAYPNKHNITLKIIPKATHGLLKAKHFNTQNPGIWFITRLMWKGEKAFAESVFEELTAWLELN